MTINIKWKHILASRGHSLFAFPISFYITHRLPQIPLGIITLFSEYHHSPLRLHSLLYAGARKCASLSFPPKICCWNVRENYLATLTPLPLPPASQNFSALHKGVFSLWQTWFCSIYKNSSYLNGEGFSLYHLWAKCFSKNIHSFFILEEKDSKWIQSL